MNVVYIRILFNHGSWCLTFVVTLSHCELGISINLELPQSFNTSNLWLNLKFSEVKANVYHLNSYRSHSENLFFQQKKFHWCVLSASSFFWKLFERKMEERQNSNNMLLFTYASNLLFEGNRIFFLEVEATYL